LMRIIKAILQEIFINAYSIDTNKMGGIVSFPDVKNKLENTRDRLKAKLAEVQSQNQKGNEHHQSAVRRVFAKNLETADTLDGKINSAIQTSITNAIDTLNKVDGLVTAVQNGIQQGGSGKEIVGAVGGLVTSIGAAIAPFTAGVGGLVIMGVGAVISLASMIIGWVSEESQTAALPGLTLTGIETAVKNALDEKFLSYQIGIVEALQFKLDTKINDVGFIWKQLKMIDNKEKCSTDTECDEKRATILDPFVSNYELDQQRLIFEFITELDGIYNSEFRSDSQVFDRGNLFKIRSYLPRCKNTKDKDPSTCLFQWSGDGTKTTVKNTLAEGRTNLKSCKDESDTLIPRMTAMKNVAGFYVTTGNKLTRYISYLFSVVCQTKGCECPDTSELFNLNLPSQPSTCPFSAHNVLHNLIDVRNRFGNKVTQLDIVFGIVDKALESKSLSFDGVCNYNDYKFPGKQKCKSKDSGDCNYKHLFMMSCNNSYKNHVGPQGFDYKDFNIGQGGDVYITDITAQANTACTETCKNTISEFQSKNPKEKPFWDSEREAYAYEYENVDNPNPQKPDYGNSYLETGSRDKCHDLCKPLPGGLFGTYLCWIAIPNYCPDDFDKCEETIITNNDAFKSE